MGNTGRMQKRNEAPKTSVNKRYKKYHMDDVTFHFGVKEEEENVHVDDFIVVVQTKFQHHLMQKFANKGICCDSTHGTTGKRTIRIYYVCKHFTYRERAYLKKQKSFHLKTKDGKKKSNTLKFHNFH